MTPWSRAFAVGAVFLPAVLVASCSGSSSGPGECPAARFGDARNGAEDDPAHVSARASCQYRPGTHTSETVGAPKIPDALKHVVVLILENRSFDNLLSELPHATNPIQAEVATTQSNPSPDGHDYARYKETQYCIGDEANPAHEWPDAHLALANGKMNGFLAKSSSFAMGYYDENDLPYTYGLATTFAISDRYFCPVLGPTWPNHFFFYKATSCGFAEDAKSNAGIIPTCGLGQHGLLEALPSGYYKLYNEGGIHSVVVSTGIAGLDVPSTLEDLENDAKDGGTLPPVAIVGGATSGAGEDDDHPPSDVRAGDHLLWRVVHAISQDAVWSSTVLFITFDENGGFYDHVEPPRACDPDGREAPDAGYDFIFNQYGFRVPLIVVSPFAKRRYVSHADADHTSITRFIEHWLDLPALTYRDANAWPLLDLFDFGNPNPAKPDPAEPSTPPPCPP